MSTDHERDAEHGGADDPVEIARRALPVFGLSPDARISFIKQRENTVFRIDDGDAAYALRVHRPGHRSLDETRSELRHAAALCEAGVAVSRFVEPVDGGDGVVRDESGRVHLVDVQHWVQGTRHLDDSVLAWRGESNPDPELLRAVGAALGRMHAASQRIGRAPGFVRSAWDAEGLAGPAALWGDPARLAATPEDERVLREALARIRTELDALGQDPDVFGVIHADTTPENVLVADGAITLIDFDDFGEGWWLFDVATLLFWYLPHPRFAEYRDAVLDGYGRHVSTPPRALAALDTLVLARGTTYLGWAADRPGDETSAFLRAEVLPVIVARCRSLLDGPHTRPADGSGAPTAATTAATTADDAHDDARLIARRGQTIGPYSPLFYERPLHFVRGEGVWLTEAGGERYLDAYNNVPSVGHANPRVAEAVAAQLRTLNVHTRYLSEPIVDYAEALLATFGGPLDRVYFTNSGSESNELALRIARHETGASGIIVTDFSYHGNTIALAQLTTGLTVSEPFGDHVRAVHVPDLDRVRDDRATGDDGRALLAEALAEVDAAIASLVESGHGLSALLIDPSFSTEGLPRVPDGYLTGLVERVHAAGGLVIADEVQSGLGRLGDEWWGFQATGIAPDLVTLGKPLGNGFPLGGVVTSAAILESFSPENMYFNTFAGTPAAAAAGHSTLLEVRERGLVERAGELGRHVGARLGELAGRHDRVLAAKGRGLFFGLALVDGTRPDGALAKRVVEALVRERILISRIGPDDNVLKIRPPLVIERPEIDRIIDALDGALGDEGR